MQSLGTGAQRRPESLLVVCHEYKMSGRKFQALFPPGDLPLCLSDKRRVLSDYFGEISGERETRVCVGR